MKLLFNIYLVLLVGVNANPQSNLVLNNGFEKGINKGVGEVKIKGKAKALDAWYNPGKHAADLYMTPSKNLPVALSGRNSLGLVLGSSKQSKTKFEFITGKLASPLMKDQVYCICFNTVLHRSSEWAAQDVGVLLHVDNELLSDISDPTTLSATLYANGGAPMINTKWSKFCGYYVASGGEQYISFGKFGTSASVSLLDIGKKPYDQEDDFQNLAYYQLDDLSVVALDGTSDCGCAQNAPIDEGDKITHNEPPHPPYLFALDASGSMKRNGLFDTLRQNLVRFVHNLPDGTPVSFVTFASSSRKLFAGIKEARTAYQVDSLLNRAPIGGGTNVFVGLQLAYDSWVQDGPDSAKMVLVSDGEFHVIPKIVSLVKSEYENDGRKLSLIQIGARASGLQELEPYLDMYVHTTQSELQQVVASLNTNKKGRIRGVAYNCACEEEYSDTLNYHFVIDFSGSMKEEKNRAIMVLQDLFERAPDKSHMSITSFNTTSDQLYQGNKSDITMSKLRIMLSTSNTGGGTNPTPGIIRAIEIAEPVSLNRYSHIILITDLSASKLSRQSIKVNALQKASNRFDLAAHTITVDMDKFVMKYSQFNMLTKNYVEVSKDKFEQDLFGTRRSSCDYTTQPYYYNPSKKSKK